jgi:hypothetical protein
MGAWFPHALLGSLEQKLVESSDVGCQEVGHSLRQDHLSLQQLAVEQSTLMESHPN